MNLNIVETEYQSSIPIKGVCHKDFQNVAETFAINFDNYSEIGSSLCVIADGEVTVDLFVGHTSNQKNEEWNENTLAVAFSCTKAAVALCAHILIDKGLLNAQEKVTKYWPEYGKNGKDDTTEDANGNQVDTNPRATDQITIFGLKEGSNAITVIQSQQFVNVPVKNDSTGGVTDVDVSNTKNILTVFDGTNALNANVGPVGTSTDIGFYVETAHPFTNKLTTLVDPAKPLEFSSEVNEWNITEDSAEITYTITIIDNDPVSAQTKIVTAKQNLVKTFDGTIARKVDLTGDQAVHYDTAGNSPNPQAILLTATALNASSGSSFKYQYTLQNNASGAIDKSGYVTSNTVTYTPNLVKFDIDTVTVEISEDNGTNVLATDTLSIYGIQDGSDVVTAILSNEAHSLTKKNDSQGTITSTGSGTDIIVFQGTKELTFVTETGIPSNEETFTVAIAGGSLPSGVTGGSRTKPSNKKHCNVAEYIFNSFTGQSATITYTITFKNDVGETGTIIKQQTFSISEQGIEGPKGNKGVGVVFRGLWAPDKIYTGATETSDRGDVVFYDDGNSEYWIAQETHESSASFTNDEAAGRWEPFGAQFESVATDLLLAKDAVITHTLTMGQGDTLDGTEFVGHGGLIKTVGKEFGNGVTGFFLGNTGSPPNPQFDVGGESSFIRFDGDSDRVEIKGSLIINSRDYTDLDINSTSGEDATFIGGGYNNFITGSEVGQNGLASSIVGGGENDISGRFSFIGGGFNNNLGDNFSAIVAGYNNEMPNLETGNAGANFIGAGVLNVIDGGSSQSVCNGKFNEIIYSPELYLGEIVPEDQTNVVFNDNMDLLGDKYFAFDPKDGVYPIEDFIIGDASLSSAVPNVKLITLAYRSLLYREPDSAGMNSYLGFSDMGSVVSNIKGSSEYSTRQNNLPAPKLQMILADSSKGITDPLCIIGSRIAEKFHVPRDFLSGTRNIALGSFAVLENPFYTKDPDLFMFFTSNSRYYDSSSEFGYWVYGVGTTAISDWLYISPSYSSEGIWVYNTSYGWIFIFNSETLNLSYGAYQRFDNRINYKLSDGSVIP